MCAPAFVVYYSIAYAVGMCFPVFVVYCNTDIVELVYVSGLHSSVCSSRTPHRVDVYLLWAVAAKLWGWPKVRTRLSETVPFCSLSGFFIFTKNCRKSVSYHVCSYYDMFQMFPSVSVSGCQLLVFLWSIFWFVCLQFLAVIKIFEPM